MSAQKEPGPVGAGLMPLAEFSGPTLSPWQLWGDWLVLDSDYVHGVFHTAICWPKNPTVEAAMFI